jgi:IS605 OrfB family transposase
MKQQRRKPPPKDWSRTFQLRLHGEYPALDGMAVRYGDAKRNTFAQVYRTGSSFDDIKTPMCERFGLPARVFNSIEIDLKGMVKSRHEKSALDAEDAADKLARVLKAGERARKRMAQANLDNAAGENRKQHSIAVQKKESADRLRARMEHAKAESEAVHPSICFGSAKRFNAQHHLHANRYASHEEWRNECWLPARSDQFLIVGSEDESSGNGTCRATVNADGSVQLRLYVGREDEDGNCETVILDGLHLNYGHDVWVAAIEAGDEEAKRSRRWQRETSAAVEALRAAGTLTKESEAELRKARKAERAKQPKVGAAIAYRFVKDGYGWRILPTITQPIPMLQADFSKGAVGYDLNDGFVSRLRVDANGAFVDTADMDMTLRGLTSGQRLAVMHDLVDRIVKEALALGLPIVIELLNFTLKKLRLREAGCTAAARRLSSFAYAKFAELLKSHARLHGVAVVEVNPAFTSVIGAALHAVPNGLSVHGAAAMAIARRAMGIEEILPATMRVWQPHGAPLPVSRPNCLQSKASVDPAWEGWKEVLNAVHAARDTAKYLRSTGRQRRQLLANERALKADGIPWESFESVVPPGGTPGETSHAVTAGATRSLAFGG